MLGELAQCEGGGAAEAVVAQTAAARTSRTTGQCPKWRPSVCLYLYLLVFVFVFVFVYVFV